MELPPRLRFQYREIILHFLRKKEFEHPLNALGGAFLMETAALP
jgi:hypothetical protein